jgi:hypothetical protein
MADQHSHPVDVLVARRNQGLVAIPGRKDGEDVVYYMLVDGSGNNTDERANIERALAAAGSWSDLDADEVLDALDRIRHSSPPSPPLDLDD